YTRPLARPIAFVEPRTLDEAAAFLAEHGEEAKVVAGATALTILLRARLISPTALVSLRRLPGLGGIESRDGVLRIGALVTHREAETSSVVRGALPVLSSTFARVASVRVRCAATVGGVLAEADYASDPPCVFVGLDADVVVRSTRGERRIPAGDFFLGF